MGYCLGFVIRITEKIFPSKLLCISKEQNFLKDKQNCRRNTLCILREFCAGFGEMSKRRIIRQKQAVRNFALRKGAFSQIYFVYFKKKQRIRNAKSPQNAAAE